MSIVSRFKILQKGIICNSSSHHVMYVFCLAIRFIKERQQKEQIEVAVVTKFAALPWRFGRGSVLSALKKSLDRLGLSSVELYQLHWSAPLLSLIHLPVCKLSPFLTVVFSIIIITFSGQGYGGMKVDIKRNIRLAKSNPIAYCSF